MEITPEQHDRELQELLEQLLAEIVADPKVRMAMLITQPIDVEKN